MGFILILIVNTTVNFISFWFHCLCMGGRGTNNELSLLFRLRKSVKDCYVNMVVSVNPNLHAFFCWTCFIGFFLNFLVLEYVAGSNNVLYFFDRLKHRGPDWSGLYQNGDCFLSHQRLAVIDPASGDQPLYNEDQTIVVTVRYIKHKFLFSYILQMMSTLFVVYMIR